jgi:stress response protein YsnF
MNNTINNSITIKTNNNNFTPKTNWQKGDILVGKVIEKTKETIKIDFEGKKITVNNNIKIQEKMTDIIKLQIDEIDTSNIKLK